MNDRLENLCYALDEIRRALFHSKGVFIAQHKSGEEISERLKAGLLNAIRLLEDEERYLTQEIKKEMDK